jgi:hypothetical protein
MALACQDIQEAEEDEDRHIYWWKSGPKVDSDTTAPW